VVRWKPFRSGGSGPEHPAGATAFFSGRPDEENHELVLFSNPRLVHVAFRVASLADLREKYRELVDRGVEIEETTNHGCSIAFYVRDPEGHRIEFYWETSNVRHWQPYLSPADLNASDDELLADVERIAREAPAATAALAGR
jgi:catechol-2,3-dioxygenase